MNRFANKVAIVTGGGLEPIGSANRSQKRM